MACGKLGFHSLIFCTPSVQSSSFGKRKSHTPAFWTQVGSYDMFWPMKWGCKSWVQLPKWSYKNQHMGLSVSLFPSPQEQQCLLYRPAEEQNHNWLVDSSHLESSIRKEHLLLPNTEIQGLLVSTAQPSLHWQVEKWATMAHGPNYPQLLL